jgi:hypothetical protein
MDREQSQAITELAEAVRRCIRALGPSCTARLMGLVAIDLLADGPSTIREPGLGSSDRRRGPSRRPPR